MQVTRQCSRASQIYPAETTRSPPVVCLHPLLLRSESSHHVSFLIDQHWPLQVERTAISAEPDGIGQIPNPQSG
jgi:hypothetical protein